MIRLEHKFIIDYFCLKNEKKLYPAIDYEYLLQTLIEHRVFLLVYNDLIEKIPPIHKPAYKFAYFNYIKKNNALLDFFKFIMPILIKSGLKFVVLKGVVNEYIIYGTNNSRMYGDLDILVSQDDFELLLQYLSTEPTLEVEIKRINDYYSHEALVIIKHQGSDFLLEVKRRHREINFHNSNYYLHDTIKFNIGGVDVDIMNITAIFLSLCIYLYNYTERCAAWLSSRKIRFCYFVDLYNLIINQYETIDFNEAFFVAKDHKNIHKIVLVLLHLYNIFHDEKIYNLHLQAQEIYEQFKYEIEDIEYVGRINWNISIQNRIFNYKKVSKIIQEYMWADFFLTSLNKTLQHTVCGTLYNSCPNLSINYTITNLINQVVLTFDHTKDIKQNNLVIAISLYGCDKYGDFRFPFVPIVIRYFNNKFNAFNRFVIDYTAGIYNYTSEQLLSYQSEDAIILHEEEELLTIELDKVKLDISSKINDKLAFRIEMINLDGDKIYISSRTTDVYDLPLVLNV